MNKVKIIEISNELGLGGTEYALQLYCKFLNKNHFDIIVIALYQGGPREKLIKDIGVNVIVLNGDLIKLALLIQQTDVFHWHGGGWVNHDIFDIIKEYKPKLIIQTNVFGLYDHSPLYKLLDYDLFISKMILARRIQEDKDLVDNFIKKRRVLSYPVDVDYINCHLPTNSQIKKFKQDNNLEDYFIVGRIGRADNAKFDLITLDGFAEFANKVSNARFLLVGATDKLLEYAQELNIYNKLIIFDNTSDLETLLFYYKSLDIFLAASHLGESFGMVIAEAMAVGIPVVTISTEDRDNAQIELVDNNKTGLVVERDSSKIASALYYLYNNKDVRISFSIASKEKVIKNYKADHIVKSFEGLIFNHLKIANPYQQESLVIDYSKEIADDYANRCSDLWEPDSNTE